jgi:uncharacterized membrane protein
LESNFLAEIHPKVVHFPIALLTVYSLLEIFGIILKNTFITKSALLIFCLGLGTAFFAVLTGNEASAAVFRWDVESSILLNTHQQYATYLLWSSVLICAFRIFLTVKKKFERPLKYIFILTSLLILYLVYQTGVHGGDLDDKIDSDVEFLNNTD